MQLQDLEALVQAAVSRMSPRALRLWELIAIPPAKWALHPWADEDGGFWVVAVLGRHVVWYNSIEDGFNTSASSAIGTIDEYWCDQKSLEHVVYGLLHQIDTNDVPPKAGPPRALAP
jgi:hypothetical protein